MTRFFVNETEVPSPPRGISSLDEVLRHVERAYLDPGNVIRQVQVDGLPVLPDGVGEVAYNLFDGIDKREMVEITTGSLQEIARDSVREAASYLIRIESIIPSLASSFRIHPGTEAFQNLKELYTGLYWLNVLLDRLKNNLGMVQPDISMQDVAICEHQGRFISALRQLVESQEQGDVVLVADLLEYEILPIVSAWKELFAQIARRVDSTPTA